MGDLHVQQPTRRPGYVVRSCSEFDTAKQQPLTEEERQREQQRFARLADELRKQLPSTDIFLRGLDSTSAPSSHNEEATFEHSTTLFNSAAPLAAWVVVRPTCANDVVITVRFCSANNISPSIRSGGFSTAGWSIQGEIVLDMRAMSKVCVVPPLQRYVSVGGNGLQVSNPSEPSNDERSCTLSVQTTVSQSSDGCSSFVHQSSDNDHTQILSTGLPLPSRRADKIAVKDDLGERWKRHHRPPHVTTADEQANRQGTSAGNGLVLPTSGGFVWTAGSGDGDSYGSARPMDIDEVANFGSVRNPSYTNSMWAQQNGGFATGSHRQEGGLGTPNGDCEYSDSSKRLSADRRDRLLPGIHKDRFIYVECEPGVGARQLDSYTESYGHTQQNREGLTVQKETALEISSCSRDGDGHSAAKDNIQVEYEGVSYHVPLSAYPVGSTAMTIGGFGYLSRAYGLSLDNLVEVDLVLADGRLVTLNASSAHGDDAELADLWWAVRGAAPCLGVVTRMVAKAYAVPHVYAGNLIYPFNPATAPSLVRHWRDCLKGTGGQVPRELYSNLILTAGPPGNSMDNVIVIQVCYLGNASSEGVGHSFVQAINSWSGERVLLKDVSEKSFLSQQDGVAQVLKSGNGRRWMVRGDLLTTLTDEVISNSVKHFSNMGDRAVWLFELVGGAIADNSESQDTCVGAEQRKAKFTAAALQQWADREEDVKCVNGVESWISDVLSTVSVGGPYAAFLERGESRARCEGSFGKDNFERLLRIKKAVDPQGMFKHTFGRGLTDFI